MYNSFKKVIEIGGSPFKNNSIVILKLFARQKIQGGRLVENMEFLHTFYYKIYGFPVILRKT